MLVMKSISLYVHTDRLYFFLCELPDFVLCPFLLGVLLFLLLSSKNCLYIKDTTSLSYTRGSMVKWLVDVNWGQADLLFKLIYF